MKEVRIYPGFKSGLHTQRLRWGSGQQRPHSSSASRSPWKPLFWGLLNPALLSSPPLIGAGSVSGRSVGRWAGLNHGARSPERPDVTQDAAALTLRFCIPHWTRSSWRYPSKESRAFSPEVWDTALFDPPCLARRCPPRPCRRHGFESKPSGLFAGKPEGLGPTLREVSPALRGFRPTTAVCCGLWEPSGEERVLAEPSRRRPHRLVRGAGPPALGKKRTAAPPRVPPSCGCSECPDAIPDSSPRPFSALPHSYLWGSNSWLSFSTQSLVPRARHVFLTVSWTWRPGS